MASKNPVGKLAETALSTLKDPKGAAGKVVGQAKGTVALGKLVADTAGAVVGKAAGEATGRLRGKRPQTSRTVPVQRPSRPSTEAPTARGGDLRAVPDVNEPAHTGAADSPKKQGDALATPETPATKAPAVKKAPAAKKAPAEGAPAAKKPVAKKTPAKKAPAKKAPSKETAPSPADVAEVVEAKVAEDPTKTAAKKTAKKSPAKKAPAGKSPAAKKAPAKKATPGGKLPAKKAQPKSAAELAANEGEDARTQAGTPAASEGSNPSTGDTSLTQRDTAPLGDEPTAKTVASKSAQLRKAAEKNPE